MAVPTISSPEHQKITIEVGGKTVYDGDLLPTLWWIVLTMGSCMNLLILLRRLANMPKNNAYARKMVYCAAAFVFACAVRSIWPRVDVERICFWDSRLSVTFVGRLLATVAEICFSAQFSMTIGMLATEVKYYKMAKLSDAIFWAICVAQCCCWMGVTTHRQLWHGIEESIWAITFTFIAIDIAMIYLALRKNGFTSESSCCLGVCESGEVGYAKRFLVIGFPLCLAYVLFMVLVDVPMYLHRYAADQARGTKYLWVSQGMLDAMGCDRVSKSMEDWAPEMPWMSGYFIGATLVSLWLTWGPSLSRGDEIKEQLGKLQ